jgi:tetratricopeptide (TPR) repeat protein
MGDSDDLRARIRAADLVIADEAAAASSVMTARLDKASALIGLGRFADVVELIDAVLTVLECEPGVRAGPPGVGAQALRSKAVALRGLGRADEAYGVVNELVASCGADEAVEVRREVATAERLSAEWMYEDARVHAALAMTEDTLARIGDSEDEALRGDAARVLCLRAALQNQMGCSEAQVATLEQLVERYGNVSPPSNRDVIVDAMLALSIAYFAAARYEEMLAACDRLLDRLSHEDAHRTATSTAETLRQRSLALWHLGRRTELLEGLEEIHARYADADQPSAREVAAQAVIDKAIWFLREDNATAAIAASDDAVGMFEREVDPAVGACVGSELLRLGGLLSWGGWSPCSEPLTVAIMQVQRVAQASRPAWSGPLARAVSRSTRARGLRNAMERERHWARATRLRQRLAQAARINDRLIACCRDATEPPHYRLYVSALINHGITDVLEGRLRSAWNTYSKIEQLGEPAISAIVTSAKPLATGGYNNTARIAALLGTGLETGRSSSRSDTLAAVRVILSADHNPVVRRFAPSG